jgi:hypothetical protein
LDARETFLPFQGTQSRLVEATSRS